MKFGHPKNQAGKSLGNVFSVNGSTPDDTGNVLLPSRADLTFTTESLNENKRLVITAAKVGDITVLNHNGAKVLPDIYQVETNVEIDFTDWNVIGTWTVQFSSGDATAPEFEAAASAIIGE